MLRGLRLLRPALIAAMICAAAPVFAVGVTPEQATAIQREQAQARFARGRTHFEKKQFEKAIVELRASHEIVSSPNTRLMIARCLRELNRYVEAYAEFGRTAIEARELERSDRRYQQAADAADAERKDLEPKLGFVTLEVRNAGPQTEVKIAGEQIRRAAWNEPAPVMPGDSEIEVATPGKPPLKKTVTVSAGEHKSFVLDANPGAEPVKASSEARVEVSSSSSTRTWAYVAGGVGVAGLATFGIFGLMTKSTHEDLQTQCPAGTCPPQAQDDIDKGKRQQLIANIGLGVGIVGLATGITLFALSKPGKKSTTALVVSPGYVGISGQM